MTTRVITEQARLQCMHGAKVELKPQQSYVRIAGARVLIEPDPEGRDIDNCPNVNVNIKKCGKTLAVKQGYSTFVRVDGHPVCLDTVQGLTTGTPAGGVDYVVARPGQTFVGSAA